MSVEKKKLKHAALSWKILGCKFLYYKGQDFKIPSSSIPSDEYYDQIESEYKKLSKELGVKPSASLMVGFDESRPSCRMVMNHLIATKGKHLSEKVDEIIKEKNQFLLLLKEKVIELGKNKDNIKLYKEMKKVLNEFED